MSQPVVKLVKGARTLNINDQSRYFLGVDFVPPPVALEPTFAQGSSSNRYAGAGVISTRASNRNWSFTINVAAASSKEMARAIRDIQYMLSLAGDSDEPLYLRFRSNSDVTYEPLWGQDGWLCFQIEHGIASVGGEYGVANRIATNVNVRLDLIVRPYAFGLRQRLCSATGGVVEDNIAVADGQSRGLIVPLAATNKATNPVFGHTTWNNEWSAAANILATQNTDPDFLLFGQSSAKVTCIGATNRTFQQNLNAGNTNVHAVSLYAKRPDGSAITASQVAIVIAGAAVTTTYTSVGNGWYRLSGTGAGSASSLGYGIVLVNGYTLYVDGLQVEERQYVTPLIYGDLLGCAWTSTAHASTSSRTAARCRIATSGNISNAQGTLRIVWKPSGASGDVPYTGTVKLFDDSAGTNFRGSWRGATTDWFFGDGTNTIDSSADSFTANEIIILHFVWAPESLKIYKNGTQVATGSTYTPPTFGADLYIGTNSSTGEHNNGTFMDFTIFDRAMSATEAAADYANVAQLTADNQRVGSIPWLWTSDGDDDVVNHNDTDANDDNYIVCGGVPGSAPAETFIQAYSSGTVYPISIWLLDSDDFINPINLVYDLSGSSNASSSGGAYQAFGVASESSTLKNTSIASPASFPFLRALAGREIAYFVRLYDEGSALTLAPEVTPPVVLYGDRKSVATASEFRLYLTGFISVQDSPPGFMDYSINPCTLEFGVDFKRSSGSATVRVDYIMMVCRPFVTLTTASSLTETGFYYQGRRAALYHSTLAGSPYTYPMSAQGDAVELMPNKYNIVSMLIGDRTFNPDITMDLIYARIVITPRWSIL